MEYSHANSRSGCVLRRDMRLIHYKPFQCYDISGKTVEKHQLYKSKNEKRRLSFRMQL